MRSDITFSQYVAKFVINDLQGSINKRKISHKNLEGRISSSFIGCLLAYAYLGYSSKKEVQQIIEFVLDSGITIKELSQ